MRQLANRNAIVTGASSGIGYEVAIALARKGVNLALVARREEQLRQLAATCEQVGVRAVPVPADVSVRADAEAAVARSAAALGPIDILVCAAGVYPRCAIERTTVELIEQTLAVNFYGEVYFALALLPEMLRARSGHIVMVSSMDGRKGVPPDGAYVVSKFALAGLTDVMRQELRPRGVGVTGVYVGRVDTAMVRDLWVPAISKKLPPAAVAGAIVRAIEADKAEVIMPAVGARLLILLNAVSSELGDLAVRLFGLSGREQPRS